MALQRSLLYLVIANLLIPSAILLFATGFFPYKPFLPGKASFKTGDVHGAPFDKIIFMVVDALRRSKAPRTTFHPKLTSIVILYMLQIPALNILRRQSRFPMSPIQH